MKTVAPHQYGNMIFCVQTQTKQTKRRISVKQSAAAKGAKIENERRESTKPGRIQHEAFHLCRYANY